ncbi:unnamed protein product, partial [Gulo gulo]
TRGGRHRAARPGQPRRLPSGVRTRALPRSPRLVSQKGKLRPGEGSGLGFESCRPSPTPRRRRDRGARQRWQERALLSHVIVLYPRDYCEVKLMLAKLTGQCGELCPLALPWINRHIHRG